MILSRQLTSVCGRVVGFELRACVQTTTAVQQAARVAAGPRRTAQPASQQLPASQPVSVFCNFLFLLLPHFFCIYVCVPRPRSGFYCHQSRIRSCTPVIPISSKRQNSIYFYSSYCASQYLIAVCALWCTHLIIFSININYIIGITLG